jgi:ankyrin repeat protein
MRHTHSLFPAVLAAALLLAACRPTPTTPLAAAAYRGDTAAVKTLLDATSADTAADGWTPLIWAIRAGRVDVMTLLLDAGADPNRRDNRQGWTPLMHAQHVKQDAAARLLLARGADGTAGAAGTSPLEMASLDNDVEMLRALLAVGPPRDQQLRAIDLAVSGGAFADLDRPLLGMCRTEAVTVLLAHDRTLGRIHERVGSPLWWARRQGCEGTIARVTAASGANLAQKTP